MWVCGCDEVKQLKDTLCLWHHIAIVADNSIVFERSSEIDSSPVCLLCKRLCVAFRLFL